MVQRRVYFEGGSYKRVSKCFATSEKAEAYAAKVNGEREQTVHSGNCYPAAPSDSGTVIECAQFVGSDMTFYDYMRYYFNDSGQHDNCGYDTKRCYITAANQIQRELEKMNCNSIRLKEVDDTILNKVTSNMVNGNASQSSIDKVYIVIKMLLKYANCKGHAFINTDLIRKGKSLVKEKERSPYTDEEFELIFSAAKSNLRLYAFLAISLCAGMRPSEIRALNWKRCTRILTLCVTYSNNLSFGCGVIYAADYFQEKHLNS